MKNRRLLPVVAVLSMLLPLSACGGEAETGGGGGGDAAAYPSEPITLVIPYAAGGPTDQVARSLAPFFEEELGQSVVPENRPGGSGALGMARMIQAGPDGHTLQILASSAAAVTPLVEDVDYDESDYVTIGAISQYPYVLAVRADSEYASAEDFFEAAEADPGSLSVAVPGASSQGAVELQRLAEEYDVVTTPVPFDGNAGSIAALLGGNVDATFVVASDDILTQMEAGEFRPIAVGSAERASYLPDTPTLQELGYEDLTMGTSYYGLAAPAGTPDEVVARLEDTLEAALEDPEVVERIGEKYVPEEFISGEELGELFAEQRAAYEPVLSGTSD
ncbi:tripartite tricarboxylate transporter substrate binding protein [Blastococcus capsensis]|nr:tripartite tricarboxylate transporter substrate binding protein [Blastococcus capsensis]MDK3257776.1 tripartite tricarboxylate transporter substrate binding protein [Blastococcus capsensis]